MIITIIIFIVILGLLIFVHEFGHFVTAKKAGLRVDEFGFGFPPRLFGIRRLAGGKDGAAKTWRLIWGQPKGEAENNFSTIYSVNWIPLGGFVKIYGEDGEGGENKRSFAAQKPGRRVLILLAGVTMNVILAAFLFCVGFFIGLPQEITAGNEARARDIKIQIIDVAADSPAKLAGLKLGDSMLKISESKGGESLMPAKIEDVQNFTQKYLGSVLNLEVRRGAEIVRLEVLARENYPQNQGPMGIAMARTGIVSFPWYQNIWEGIKITVILLGNIIIAFGLIIKNLIFTGKVAEGLAGPVGIFIFTGEAARLGLIYLLQFTALISLNLAVINALPLPALDGGRVLFVLIEKIKGSPVSQKIEQMVHNIGFALLLALILLITIRDVGRFL